MMIFLVIFVVTFGICLWLDSVEKRRYMKDLRWMIASIRCGHLDAVDDMLNKHKAHAIEILTQADLVLRGVK